MSWSRGGEVDARDYASRGTSHVDVPSVELRPGPVSWALFAVGLVLFGTLHGEEFVRFDTRFALFARDLLEHGVGLFPTIFGQPYPDYPVTTTLFIGAVSSLAGGVSPLVAFLPTATASALTLVLTFRIGALHSRHWGLGAAGLLLLTSEFFKSARSLVVDQYPTVLTALGVWLVLRAALRERRIPLFSCSILLVMSFLTRGPIGLVVPAGVLGVVMLAHRRTKEFCLWGILAATLLAACSGGLLLAARHAGGDEFARRVWQAQVSGRMASRGTGLLEYALLVLGSYSITLPLAAVAVFALLRGKARAPTLATRRTLIALVGAVAIVVVGFAIPGGKKMRYLLPMAPALALLAGWPLTSGGAGRNWAALRRVLAALAAVAPWLAILALAVTWIFYPEVQIRRTVVLALLSGGCALSVRFWRKYSLRPSGGDALAAAVLTACAVQIGAIESVAQERNRTRPFVRAVEQTVGTDTPVVFFATAPDSIEVKYLVNAERYAPPEYARNLARIRTLATRSSVVSIATRSSFESVKWPADLGVRVVAEGRLGHRPAVAFVCDFEEEVERRERSRS